jgi:hypothetical protein
VRQKDRDPDTVVAMIAVPPGVDFVEHLEEMKN